MNFKKIQSYKNFKKECKDLKNLVDKTLGLEESLRVEYDLTIGILDTYSDIIDDTFEHLESIIFNDEYSELNRNPKNTKEYTSIEMLLYGSISQVIHKFDESFIYPLSDNDRLILDQNPSFKLIIQTMDENVIFLFSSYLDYLTENEVLPKHNFLDFGNPLNFFKYSQMYISLANVN